MNIYTCATPVSLFWGWDRGKVGTSIVGIFGRWEGVAHIFCAC